MHDKISYIIYDGRANPFNGTEKAGVLGVAETLDHAESLIQEIVESYFGSDETSEEKIVDYHQVIHKIKSLLTDVGSEL